MRNFLAFQKKKGLYAVPSENGMDNLNLVHQINHELMNVGYIMTEQLVDVLSTQSEQELNVIYNDLIKGIKEVTGGDGYEPIYRNFPQSVTEMSYLEFLMNALGHYWTFGSWRPEDAEFVNREFKLEVTKFKKVGLLTEAEYNSIFTDIVYSGTSISRFDKKIIDFFLQNETIGVNLGKISFKETLAYVGVKMIDYGQIPTQNATDVLRIWAAYSGGDEGLKENTRFKKPTSRQARLLRETLDNCYNLEDSFKTYREPWLRVLFYLNPMTTDNKVKYPTLYSFANDLRNAPKKLETFNAKVERMIREKDTTIFKLLKNRAGVFTRRLDHLVRTFGKVAIEEYVNLDNVSFLNLAAAYNHFTDRDKVQEGRGAILASQDKSELVTYDALEPLDSKLVAYIKEGILNKMNSDKYIVGNKAVFIDRPLFYSPLQMNNRASSLTLDSSAKGTAMLYNGGKTIRMYAHWEGRDDIDLSGFIIGKDNSVTKVGWNGRHHNEGYVVYSGDNTGYSAKNAEYLDINTDKIPANVEWIISEARIYRGKRTYAEYKGTVHMGWMGVDHPEANNHWQPKQLENAMVIESKSNTAYLMAYHAPSKNVVYLDMAMGSAMVSNEQDALKMRMFLEKFVVTDEGKEISWDRLNQGHLLSMRLPNQVEDSKEADVVFDEHTSIDEINRLLSI